ncbi:MAG: SRPBCC family protein [Bermanella sp.]
MTDSNEDLGSIINKGGYYQATLSRVLDHDVKAVWAMLTEPARFLDWLAPGEIELAKGGKAKLNFVDSGIVIDSVVSEYEENSLIEYSWSSGDEPARPVCWKLNALNDGTQLTLTLGIPDGEDVARSCAGWEAHLMMLLAAIEGVPIKFPFQRFVSSREAYNQLLAQ